MKVHILTKGLRSYNGIAFLTPLILNQNRLAKAGIEIVFFTRLNQMLTDCDVLIAESKFFVEYWENTDQLFDLLQSFKKQNQLYFFDLGDSSSSWVLGVIPFVDRLYKSYLLKDKTLYTKALYGGRVWTDYYHQAFNIVDDNQSNNPKFFADEKDLHKICLGYGAGLGNYTLNSIFWQDNLNAKLAKRLWCLRNFSVQATKASFFTKPSVSKTVDLSARMSIKSYSATVGFQRQQTAKQLESLNAPSTKLSRKDYMSELAKSKVVISPFGWGELNAPRDYEVAMSGAVLLKPDISHLETWPPIFNKKTVVEYAWDFSDLQTKVENIIRNYDDYVDYAIALQNQYKHFLVTDEGNDEFCQYFKKILAH